MSKNYLLRLNDKDKRIIEIGASIKGISEQKLIQEYGIKVVVEKLLKEYPQIKALL